MWALLGASREAWAGQVGIIASLTPAFQSGEAPGGHSLNVGVFLVNHKYKVTIKEVIAQLLISKSCGV